MYAPVYDGERFEGFVLYVHRVEPMFDAAIGEMSSKYAVRLRDGGETVYDSCREREITTIAASSARSGPLSIAGLKLKVTVTPTKALVDTFITRLPETVGIVGNALALAVGLLIFQQSSARRRMRALARNSRALEEQVVMRQRAEDSERVSHDELARILASVGECLWSVRLGPDGRLEKEFLSEIIEEITGYPVEYFSVAGLARLEDEPWLQLVVPEDREAVRALYTEIPKGTRDHQQFEYRITRSDGEIVWIRESYVLTRDLSGASQFDVILTDISAIKRAEEDRRRLEERVQQTQKLESIGVLAGGIAHDFNNLLVGVLGNANLAASSDDCPIHVRESLIEIETAAQRASELCRELLVYSGRAPYVIAPTDLGDLVGEMEKLLRFSIAPGIRIEIDIPEESALIEGDTAQLRQLVMNLITNAADSMADNPGKIQISINERRCEDADLARTFTHDSLPAGQYVVLSVTDTGCGMTEETRSRIFDPFFSTKVTGRGLGLAAVLGIVRGHHGAISVTSELGVGTRSLVYLPALAKEQVKPVTGTPEAAWHTSGVVLHVDDEDSVRRVGALMLERLGMKVIPAASGEEALSILDSDAHEFRCVILDLMMPGLSGTDTLRAIRERDSDLPVLIVTGYGESDASDLLGGLSATGLLAKPFTSKQLQQALRSALGE
jgi:PAS domain S-box-containing protein